MRMNLGSSARPSMKEGNHEVVIDDVIVKYNEETKFGLKDLFHIDFKSPDGAVITGKYIAYYDQKSQFGQVVQAVFEELPKSFEIDQLRGKHCQITVEAVTSSQQKTFYNVVRVSPSNQSNIDL